MRIIENEYGRVEAFDATVWLQERNLLVYEYTRAGQESSTVRLYKQRRGPSILIATYTLDADGRVVIDVTDYIRAYPVDTLGFSLRADVETQSLLIPFNVGGLINPKSLVIPQLPFDAPESKDLTVTMPTALYYSSKGYDVEFRGTFSTAEDYIADEEEGGGPVIQDGSMHIPADFSPMFVYIGGELKRIVRPREIPCGVRFAYVEWVGETGAKKSAVWLVKSVKSSAKDSVKLLPSVGDYRTVKGREDGLTLYIDGLTQYDLFYYGDIAFSSDVRVRFDEQAMTERDRVEILTNNVSLPDGNAGEMNVLEVNINFKKYDAISL